MCGKVKIVADTFVLGEDDPIARKTTGLGSLDIAIGKVVGQDALPEIRIMTVIVRDALDHLVQVSVALAPRDAPSLANVSDHMAGGEEVPVPEWEKRRAPELTGGLDVALRSEPLQCELPPEVGDGGNREGGISWGCLTTSLLHRRSDMPCPTITSSD